jgi:hypothetical protein
VIVFAIEMILICEILSLRRFPPRLASDRFRNRNGFQYCRFCSWGVLYPKRNVLDYTRRGWMAPQES